MPSVPGVKIISAPRAFKSFLLSTVIVSGITSLSLYPRAAHTHASAMPVFPLVGSRIVVPSLILPSLSACSIIARPILSFTLPIGLKDSTLTSTSAFRPFVMRFNLTRGVFPIVQVISEYIRPILFTFLLQVVPELLEFDSD